MKLTCAACGGSLRPLSVGARMAFQCFACQTVYVGPYPVIDKEVLEETKPVWEESAEEVPILEGSVIGYRAWRISDWQLCGSGINAGWLPGVQRAQCKPAHNLTDHPSHLAPAPGCGCGIYALARFDPSGQGYWSRADVCGAIEAWSDDEGAQEESSGFIVQPPGFRARYARVVLLATDAQFPRAKNAAIRALATEHGADVCQLAHLEDAAKEHGQLLPEHLLEWARPQTMEDHFPSFTHWLQINANAGATFRRAVEQMQAMLNAWAPAPHFVTNPGPRPITFKPRHATNAQTVTGVKAVRKVPGPPGLGKWRKGDTIRDSKGCFWLCVRGGKPGSWRQVT